MVTSDYGMIQPWNKTVKEAFQKQKHGKTVWEKILLKSTRDDLRVSNSQDRYCHLVMAGAGLLLSEVMHDSIVIKLR